MQKQGWKTTGLGLPECSKLLEKETQQKLRSKGNIPMDLASSAPTEDMAGSPASCYFHAAF